MVVFIVTKLEKEKPGPFACSLSSPSIEVHGVYLSEELADSIADDLDDSDEYVYASVGEHIVQ